MTRASHRLGGGEPWTRLLGGDREGPLDRPRIPLVRDTIGQDDLDALADWIRTGPRLTKGPQCLDFEARFTDWEGCGHALYVNSGSSANLLAVDALRAAGRLKDGDKVIAPAVSWTTTIAPITQLNLRPVLCDVDLGSLGLDLDHLERLAADEGARALMVCHVLGIPNDMRRITEICQRHDLALIEDCCEALGSEYEGRKVGTFGDLSTFSFYFGHHMSTIEGGMVCASTRELANVIKSLRSHGWNRDLDPAARNELRRKWDVDPFADQYTFYLPGYNFRGTDVGAFLGLRQLQKLDGFVAARRQVWAAYDELLAGATWRPRVPPGGVDSGFAWPLLSSHRSALAERLVARGIETRPLICGSMGRQPWFVETYGAAELPHADMIHRHGMYVPINPDLSAAEVEEIAGLVLAPGPGSVAAPLPAMLA